VCGRAYAICVCACVCVQIIRRRRTAMSRLCTLPRLTAQARGNLRALMEDARVERRREQVCRGDNRMDVTCGGL